MVVIRISSALETASFASNENDGLGSGALPAYRRTPMGYMHMGSVGSKSTLSWPCIYCLSECAVRWYFSLRYLVVNPSEHCDTAATSTQLA